MLYKEVKPISFIQDLNKKADYLAEEFSDFTDGVRVLLLLQRNKDGGHNSDEEKRVFETYTTNSPEEFRKKLFNLLLIKFASNPKARIYVSANKRDPKKVIRYIEEQLLSAHYCDDQNRNSIYLKLLKNPRHFLMQTRCASESLFIIDVDDIDGVPCFDLAVNKIEELGIVERKRYRTKNGWHFIVEPFNPNLWDSVGEIKKDPLILLDF